MNVSIWKKIILGLCVILVSILFLINGGDNPPPGYDVGGGVCNCTSCSDCTNAINDALCTTIQLTANITGEHNNCIDNPLGFNNKIFDCLGNTIDGDHGGWADWGIHLDGKQNNTIKNCIITDYPIGIILDSSVNNTIQNNNLSSNGGEEGLRLEVNSDLNNILNNVISDNVGDGIGIYDSVYNTVNNNTIFSNNNGIEVYTANNNTITYNTIYDNVIGINIIFLSLYNDVTNNNISSNLQDGIYLSATSISNLITLNLVCVNNQSGGAYYDINDLDSNTGDNNTCNTTSNWNDTGTTGCTFYCGESCINNITNTSWVNYANSSCYSNSTMDLNWSLIEYDVNDCGNVSNTTYYMTNSTSCTYVGDCNCSSCDECELKLNDNSCTTVNLTANITNQTGTCIDDPANFTGKTFDCQGFTIDGDDIGATDYGISLLGKTDNTIKNCVISDFYHGVLLWTASNSNNLTNNTINSNTVAGVYSSSAYYNNYFNNTFNSNGGGIALSTSSNNNLTGNVFNSSTYGVSLYWALDNNFINNSINFNTYGFMFESSSGNTFTNNTLLNNTFGVYLYKSNSNTINLNDIEYGNDTGVYMTSTSSLNTLSNNTICANNLTGLGQDIYDGDSNTGGNNTCTEANTWNDSGYVGCSMLCNGSTGCVVNRVNTSWTLISNSSCLPNDTVEWNYSLIEYDSSSCFGSVNITYYLTNYSSCDYCTPNLVNTSWVSVSNSSCLPNNTIQQNFTLIEYDNNSCNETVNVTYYMTNYTSCSDCLCSDCSGCELDINDALCSVINLTADITSTGKCLNNPLWTGKTFDCQNYTITGDRVGASDYGLYFLDRGSSIIKNCRVYNFYYGIYLVNSTNNLFLDNWVINSTNIGFQVYQGSNSNNLTNNTINSVGSSGLSLSMSKYNRVEGNNISSNTAYGVLLSGISETDSNILNNNTICSNTIKDIGVLLSSGNTGDDNKCNTTSGWSDGSGEVVCRYLCDGTSCDVDYDNYTVTACSGTDCNDNNASINPAATEVCDFVDNNCSGTIDDLPACCYCTSCLNCNKTLDIVTYCPTVYVNSTLSSNGSCVYNPGSNASNRVFNCSNYAFNGNLSGYGVYFNKITNLTLINCNITNYSTGVYVNNSNLTLTNNTFCGNTKDVSNTSSTLTSTNTYCRYTDNFTCDYFCSDMGYGFTYNWTIKNQSHWSSVNYNIPVWTCTAWETQCEPRGNSDYFSKQDMRRNKGIWNITSLNNCTIKTLEMSLNTTCSIEFRVSSYPNYWLSTNLSTSYTNIWNGTISTSKQLFAWADYSHPYSCDMGFLLKAGGYC